MPTAAETLERFGGEARVNVAAIECPMLCLAGEGDPPECLTQMREVFEQLRAARKEMRVFTVAEGAEAHCQVNNSPLHDEVVFDWLDAVFQPDNNNANCGNNEMERSGADSNKLLEAL
jgi:hypothetical protein